MRVAPIVPTLKSCPLFAAAIAIVVSVLCWTTERPALAALAPGSGSFQWTDQSGQSDPNKTLTVQYFRPDVVDADTPIWVIMHGMNRNADDYRGNWNRCPGSRNMGGRTGQQDDRFGRGTSYV